MRRVIRPFAISFLILTLTGCAGSVATSMPDGQAITGQSSCFSYALLDSSDKGVNINLGGKAIEITTKQLTWKRDGCLELPASWSSLELVESGDTIVVNVDGNHFARIRPTT